MVWRSSADGGTIPTPKSSNSTNTTNTTTTKVATSPSTDSAAPVYVMSPVKMGNIFSFLAGFKIFDN